jgi:hypothetical protein
VIKRRISLAIVGLLVLNVVMLSACIQKPETAIIGKWEAVGLHETIEFFKEGTVIMDSEERSISVVGKYKFVDDDTIRIDLGGLEALAGPTIFKVTFSSKDVLILSDREGIPICNYRRITH